MTNHKLTWKKSGLFIGLEIVFLILACVPFIAELQLHAFPFETDSMFHWQRVIEMERDIGHFQFPMYYHYTTSFGIATPLMYPWLNMLPISLMLLIHVSPVNSMLVFLIGTLFMGLNITYFCCKHYTNQRTVAAVCAAFYACSTLTTCQEEDFGYYTSFMLLPLVFFGWLAWRKSGKWKMMTIGLVLIAFSHILSAIFALLFVIVMTLLSTKQIDHKKLINLAKAGGTTVALTALAWLPLMVLMSMNHISQPPMDKTLKFWAALIPVTPRDLQLAITRIWSFSDIFAIILVIICWKRLSKLNKKLFWVAIAVWICNFNWLPWSLIQATPIARIQMLSRLCFISHLLLSYLLGVSYLDLAKRYLDKDERIFWPVVIMFVCACSIFMITQKPSNKGRHMTVPKPSTFVHEPYSKARYIFTDWIFGLNNEYLSSNYIIEMPTHFDYSPTTFHRHIHKLESAYSVNQYPIHDGALELNVPHTKHDAMIPMCAYYGQKYHVSVNHKSVHAFNHKGVMELSKLPKGTDKITYSTPFMWYGYLAIVLMLLGLASLIWL